MCVWYFMYQFNRPFDLPRQYFIILNSYDDHTLLGCYEVACCFFCQLFLFFPCWDMLGISLLVLGPFCSPLPLSLPLVQFEDSEEDFDSRFDTDDELSCRRDSVYSCVTLPYFHSFLYMKGTSCGRRGAEVAGRMMETEVLFSPRVIEGDWECYPMYRFPSARSP